MRAWAAEWDVDQTPRLALQRPQRYLYDLPQGKGRLWERRLKRKRLCEVSGMRTRFTYLVLYLLSASLVYNNSSGRDRSGSVREGEMCRLGPPAEEITAGCSSFAVINSRYKSGLPPVRRGIATLSKIKRREIKLVRNVSKNKNQSPREFTQKL